MEVSIFMSKAHKKFYLSTFMSFTRKQVDAGVRKGEMCILVVVAENYCCNIYTCVSRWMAFVMKI